MQLIEYKRGIILKPTGGDNINASIPIKENYNGY